MVHLLSRLPFCRCSRNSSQRGRPGCCVGQLERAGIDGGRPALRLQESDPGGEHHFTAHAGGRDGLRASVCGFHLQPAACRAKRQGLGQGSAEPPPGSCGAPPHVDLPARYRLPRDHLRRAPAHQQRSGTAGAGRGGAVSHPPGQPRIGRQRAGGNGHSRAVAPGLTRAEPVF